MNIITAMTQLCDYSDECWEDIEEDFYDCFYIQNKIYSYYRSEGVKDKVCKFMSYIISPFTLLFMLVIFIKYLPQELNNWFCEYFKEEDK